jgi:hypothetical protein
MIDCDFLRLSKSQKSFSASGIRLFNKLPPSSRAAPYPNFRKILEKWLLQQCFYSIDEFYNADNLDSLQL